MKDIGSILLGCAINISVGLTIVTPAELENKVAVILGKAAW